MMDNLAAGFQSLPDEYQKVVRLAQERNRIAVTPLQALAGGWSGAMVFLVSVASHGPDQVEHFVLKLDRKNEKSQSDEVQRHEAALRQSPPGFADQHLAQMAFDRVEADGALAMFYSIAGQSLHRYKTLSAYDKQSQVEAIFNYTYQTLLDGWNSARTFDQAVHPSAVLERWLGFRLKPGGNIENFLETDCRVPPDMAGYLVQGSILPNPLAYARRADWWGAARPIDVATGLQHGDLNTNNILVRFTRDDEALDGYYLIDFALFKEHMPLVFDQRYLEMSYLILRQTQVSFARLVDLVVRLGEADSPDPQQVPIDVAGVCAVIGAARGVFGRWVEEHYPSLHDDLWGQYWLAGVAAGLSYCHKPNIGHEQRLSGLLYDPAQAPQDRSVRRAARSASYALPAQATALIGREAEAAQVQALLASSDARLVTLTGPGGVGKTRLSLEIAARLRVAFPDGVFFIPLADIGDPALVVSKIAQTLELREGGDQPLLETVKGFLQDKQLLLVLDNFEHVAVASPVVAELLTASASLKVLVSSRVVLQVRGEQEYSVPPLETPDADRLPGLYQLGQFQAVRLFVERAQAASSQFSLTAENAPAVAEICQRLDGLPLAIELAAARVKLLPPQAMLGRLGKRLALLTGGARDLPARQQTLRSSLDLSYSLLRPEEQTLLARLGVFVGGFTLETAEAVCNPAGSLDVLEGVAALINNSLLRSEEGGGGQPRFRMLETVREYALERVEHSGEMATIQQAHGLYYLEKIVGEIGPKLYSPESLTSLDWLQSEHDNISAALAWGLAASVQIVPIVIGTLLWYWYRRGYLSEGRTWSQRVLESPLAQGDTPQRLMALQASMMLATWQGDLHAARASSEVGLDTAHHLEAPELVSRSLLGLGVVNINRGDYAAARPLLQKALELFNEAGNIFFSATTLVHLGNIALGLNKPEEARARLEEAYAISRDWGEGWINSFVLNNLGEVARVQGDYGAARRYYEQSEALLRAMGDKGDLARLVYSLGYVAQHEGDFSKAEAQFNESLAMFRTLGNRRGIAECLVALAGIWAYQGQALRAARLLGAAEATLAASGAGWWPADHAEIERNRAAIRSGLDEADFAAAWAAGQAMTLDSAVASALE